MKISHQVWLTLVQCFRHLSRLPQTFAQAAVQRRQRAVNDELETERLDRVFECGREQGIRYRHEEQRG